VVRLEIEYTSDVDLFRHDWDSETTPVQRYVGATIFFAVCAVQYYVRDEGGWSGWLRKLSAVPFGVAAIGVFTTRMTEFDVALRVVVREVRLGKVTIYRRRFPLSAFSAVALRRSPGPEDSGTDIIAVGLERSSGRFLRVRSFTTDHGSACPAAGEFASLLSRQTGLETSPYTY
jgi:hypothetical protein